MKRTSRFIVWGVCAALVLTIAGISSEPAHSATYNWKLASVLPASHPVHQALVFFADKVKEKTKGEVVDHCLIRQASWARRKIISKASN